jgi:hypothetical protein
MCGGGAIFDFVGSPEIDATRISGPTMSKVAPHGKRARIRLACGGGVLIIQRSNVPTFQRSNVRSRHQQLFAGLDEAGVGAVGREELGVGPLLDHAAVLEDHDTVGAFHR